MLSDERLLFLWRECQSNPTAFARAIEAAVLEAQGKQEPVAEVIDTHGFNMGIVSYLTPNGEQLQIGTKLHPAPAPEGMAKQCEWRHCGDEYMPGTWDGECGAKWTFTEDGPVENNMRFCPECGGEVVIAAAEKEVGKCSQ